MNARETAIAVFRGSPEFVDQIDTFARIKGWLYKPRVVRRVRDIRRVRITDKQIDEFCKQWVQGFLMTTFRDLNDDDLSLRLAIQERLLLEVDDHKSWNNIPVNRAAYAESVREQYHAIVAEMARR